MAKHTKIDIVCDLDHCNNFLDSQNTESLQVLFTTSQNDGNMVAMPNNYLLFKDKYFTEKSDDVKQYKRNSKYYTAY